MGVEEGWGRMWKSAGARETQAVACQWTVLDSAACLGWGIQAEMMKRRAGKPGSGRYQLTRSLLFSV